MPFSVEKESRLNTSSRYVDTPNFALEKTGYWLLLGRGGQAKAIDHNGYACHSLSFSSTRDFPLTPSELAFSLSSAEALSESVIDAVRQSDVRRRFIAWFEGEIDYEVISFRDDEQKLTVQLHWLVMTSDALLSPFVTAHIKPLRGFDRAAELLQHWLDVTGISQGTVKHALASHPLVPQKAIKGGTKDNVSIHTWANKRVSSHLQAAASQLEGIFQDIDIRYLHQYRVHLRKTRSMLSLFKGVFEKNAMVEAKHQTKRLMADTGALRDLDVYLMSKQDFYTKMPVTFHDGLAELFELLESRRAAALHDFQTLIASDKPHQTLASLQSKALAEGPKAEKRVRAFGHKEILKHYAKTAAIGASLSHSSLDEQVHDFRLACKKLRYLSDFFVDDDINETAVSVVAQLVDLTRVLGEFNDYCVQADFVAGLEQELNASNKMTPTLAKTFGGMMLLFDQERTRARAEALLQIDVFVAAETAANFKHVFGKK
ncbi:CHAD domain-containing protein [Enterovibrio coralii]|uniref:CHAD domain-containing protein n=1 Tax=Enterovibrio coralii TaxID=294935 RepID=A0A135I9G2_9GAMM|nr:CHAD domain-containing protein [Enterovibrio coralii]KXF82092.1 hypothetical protein ATN88_20060 [Enterovibrio coralii]